MLAYILAPWILWDGIYTPDMLIHMFKPFDLRRLSNSLDQTHNERRVTGAPRPTWRHNERIVGSPFPAHGRGGIFRPKLRRCGVRNDPTFWRFGMADTNIEVFNKGGFVR